MPESPARSGQCIRSFSLPPPLPHDLVLRQERYHQASFSGGNQNASRTPPFRFLLAKHEIAPMDFQKIKLIEEKRAKLLTWILFKITKTVLVRLSQVPTRKWSHFKVLRSLESPQGARCYDIPTLSKARNVIFLSSFPEN